LTHSPHFPPHKAAARLLILDLQIGNYPLRRFLDFQ
jgi:hypothetical protein